MHRAALLALSMLPMIALSQTLCKRDETDFFSCVASGSKKIISVCGNIPDDPKFGDRWVQYRFGRIDHVEMNYPRTREGSFSKFEGTYYNRYGVLSLRFISKKSLYDVSLTLEARDAEDPRDEHPSSAGLSVSLNRTHQKLVSCEKANTAMYFEPYGQLISSVRQHNGETDFLSDFYKFHRK